MLTNPLHASDSALLTIVCVYKLYLLTYLLQVSLVLEHQDKNAWNWYVIKLTDRRVLIDKTTDLNDWFTIRIL